MSSVMKAITSIMPQPKMPKVAPAAAMPRMPDPAAPAARLAAREKIEADRKKGREGTIYTRGGGSGSYSNQSLGGAQ
jgi:hypothetical protein